MKFKRGTIWVEWSRGQYYKGTGYGFRIYYKKLEIWFKNKKWILFK